MKQQKEIIQKLDWDYLIVLDACRADVFEQVNDIEGKYERVWSPASETYSWIKRMFPDYYNITFYSGTPVIRALIKHGYNADEHFAKIVDIWDWGFDPDLATIPPWHVYEGSKDAKPVSIIWFVQPHLPPVGDEEMMKIWKDIVDVRERRLAADIVIAREIRKGTLSPDRVRESYKRSLSIALQYVKKLIERFKGKIIVTADHGEFLGEDGRWLHPDIEHPVLRTVPLLEVVK